MSVSSFLINGLNCQYIKSTESTDAEQGNSNED